jgi:predicted  nucleic acid-binding Zn-ribbon protein
MVVHTLECTECQETRVGRDTDDGIAPVKQTCPNCGSASFEPAVTAKSD